MISQTQTASNQYGFYAVPKKLQPKKKYRQSEYQDFYDEPNNQENQFEPIERQTIPENQIERDFYVDEAPYPEFKPKERGLDYGVQIERGDLFDFDLEVQPLLQILVGRSIVSAINQLQEDKQKVQKKQKLEAYQKKRNAELMVTQRLQAKSKRKQQESERRVLQKQIFVKNQKQVGKKIVARKTAKKNLLGLRNQVISELQDSGYLRSQPYSDLRINFEGWLYDQITSLIRQETKIKSEVQKIVRQVENQNEYQHKEKIEKQKKRRQDILNQRERVRKLNEQRKQKKRIRKQRIELNAQREPKSIKFDQLLEKYQQLDSILKFENRSNGFSPNGNNQVHISGGLMNYLIVMLNSQSKSNYTPQETEEMLTKILNESQAPLEVQFLEQHFNGIQEQLHQMVENPNLFMNTKAQRVTALMGKTSLSLRLLEIAKVNIKTQLHDALLEALLNIYLTTTIIPKPQQETEQVLYVPSEKDKQRQQLRKKLVISQFNSSNLEQLSTVLRVRYERKQISQAQNKQQIQQKQQPKQDEYVEIYDGQGWSRHCAQFPQELPRQGQKPAAIAISGFERAFIYDQRILYCLRKQLEKLLDAQSGQQLQRYFDVLSNLGAALKLNVPVYDGELRTAE